MRFSVLTYNVLHSMGAKRPIGIQLGIQLAAPRLRDHGEVVVVCGMGQIDQATDEAIPRM